MDGNPLDKNPLKVSWNQLRSIVKRQWGKLTESDLDEIDGDVDKLAERIQRLYGYPHDQVAAEVELFTRQIQDIYRDDVGNPIVGG